MTLGQVYTRDEVAAMVGAGGDNYILTKKGKVHALTLNPEMNPKAPEIVIVGKGPRVQKGARLFFESKESIPTFLKCKVNQWEYVGKYKAIDLKLDQQTIENYRAHRKANSIYGILFLKNI